MTAQAPSQSVLDCIVIGGSAAGLSTALMLGRASRSVVVVDAADPRNRFADHMHGVLGHDGLSPGDLVDRGRAEVERYGVDVIEARVESISDQDQMLSVTLADGRTLHTRTIALATGVVDLLPDVPGLAERWGRDVLHCPYCHGWEVRGRKIGVLATSPASLHQARMLRQWSDDVTFFSEKAEPITARDKQRLAARGIAIVDAPVTEILTEGDHVAGVRTVDGRVTPVAAVFTSAPTRARDELLDGLELTRAEAVPGGPQILAVDPTGKTSHPRVWAVGNVVQPGANVPMVMGAGSFAGTGINGWLVEDDFDQAETIT